ncbi:MAG: gamma-glutamyltransferase [Caldilineaceae bacterium]
MTHGAIAASDPQTAAAGAQMLRLGGTAVDAAVAAAFASFVAEASLVNIGGGGIATLVDSQSGAAEVYDFFSTMPSGALAENADFRQVLIDFGATQQPFYIGRASVAVPGVVAGLCQMAAERGTLPLPTLLQPAVELARNGAIWSKQLIYAYTLLQPILCDTPELQQIFKPNGRLFAEGERIYFPQLANTLERLGQEGAAFFYRGPIAEAIVADQAAHGGLVTMSDLANYQVQKLAPIRLPYRDCTILLPPPSSVGGLLIAFALALLADYDVGGLAHNGVEHLQLLAEVMRLTNMARLQWNPNPLAASDELQQQVSWFLSAEHLRPYQTQLRQTLSGVTPMPDGPAAKGPNDTTHISVADAEGRLVSITTSAGEYAGFVVGDTGVCLNNMLGELDLHPHGFHRLPPGARLTTMMTPTVVLRNGAPVLTLGSGGSSRIRSAILQTLSNVIDFDFPIAQAVDASRAHFEAGLLQLEGGIPNAAADALAQMGYQVNLWPTRNMYFGGAHCVAFQNGAMVPAGDGRRGGSVEMVVG